MTMEQRICNLFRAALAGAIVLGTVGCGSSPSGYNGTLAPGGASYVYSVQEVAVGSYAVEQFLSSSNGSTTPTSSLLTPVNFTAASVVVDSTGQIYVGGNNSAGIYQVLAYAPGASGTATPTRTINLTSYYNGSGAESLSVDASNNLYVLNFYGTITEYSPTANGTATPLRTITGTVLSNQYCYGVAIDGAGNLYVATANNSLTGGTILVFAAGASGNVAPTRTITTPTNVFFGIAVDSVGDVWATEDNLSGTAPASLVEFFSSASGAPTPNRTIDFTGTTPSIMLGLRMDSAGNLFTLLDTDVNNADSFSIVSVGPNAGGNIAPATQMSSTSLTNPTGEIAIK
jgi:hypothetical protein